MNYDAIDAQAASLGLQDEAPLLVPTSGPRARLLCGWYVPQTDHVLYVAPDPGGGVGITHVPTGRRMALLVSLDAALELAAVIFAVARDAQIDVCSTEPSMARAWLAALLAREVPYFAYMFADGDACEAPQKL